MRKIPYIIVALILTIIVVGPFRYYLTNHQEDLRDVLLEGERLYRNGEVFEAMTHFQRVMQACPADEHSCERAESSVDLSDIYCSAGLMDKGEDVLVGLSFCEECMKKGKVPNMYYRLQAFYAAKEHHDYDRAILMLDSAISLTRTVAPEKKLLINADLGNLAEVLLMAKRYDRALDLLNELESDTTDQTSIAYGQAVYVHAALLFEQGDYDAAYEYANRGFEVALQNEERENEVLCLELLCRVDSLRGDMTTYVEHHRLCDEYNKVSLSEMIAYQTATAAASVQNEMERSKIHDRFIISLLGIAVLVLLACGLVFVIFSNRRSYRARQALYALEKKRIEHEAVQAHMENELLALRLSQYKEDLDAKENDSKMLRNRLMEMSNAAPASSNSTSLSELEQQLNEQCLPFLLEVRKRYPVLTDNEVRLLGFVRLGIKSATVAEALNISTASLNTARYRLRKKLALPAETDLLDFVAGIA